ncbi:MAG: hypothetical protein ACRD0J_02770 [Acidimicrobiales bacterium]
MPLRLAGRRVDSRPVAGRLAEIVFAWTISAMISSPPHPGWSAARFHIYMTI